MLAQYTLLSRGFQNVKRNNQIIGFQIMVRMPYYQGIIIPKLGTYEVAVDGEKFGIDKILFTVGGGTYTFEETAYATDVRWEYTDPMILTILKPGGLKPGTHEVSVAQRIRPSYGSRVEGPARPVSRKITLVI